MGATRRNYGLFIPEFERRSGWLVAVCSRTNVDSYYVAGPSHRVSIAHNFFFQFQRQFFIFLSQSLVLVLAP